MILNSDVYLQVEAEVYFALVEKNRGYYCLEYKLEK